MTIGYLQIDTSCESRIYCGVWESIKARWSLRMKLVVYYFSAGASTMSTISTQVMYVDKVLLTIILYATSAWCSDRTLTRNARTFNSSFFVWPQALFSNRPDVSIFPKLWPSRPLQEWTRNSIASLLRLVSFIITEKEPMHIEFRLEDGPRAAKVYQRRFGYRGEWLIKQLGNGFEPDIRLNRQSAFSMPFLTSFRSNN